MRIAVSHFSVAFSAFLSAVNFAIQSRCDPWKTWTWSLSEPDWRGCNVPGCWPGTDYASSWWIANSRSANRCTPRGSSSAARSKTLPYRPRTSARLFAASRSVPAQPPRGRSRERSRRVSHRPHGPALPAAAEGLPGSRAATGCLPRVSSVPCSRPTVHK